MEPDQTPNYEVLIERIKSLPEKPSDNKPYVEERDTLDTLSCELCGVWFNTGDVTIRFPGQDKHFSIPYIVLHCLNKHGFVPTEIKSNGIVRKMPEVDLESLEQMMDEFYG